jgi:hypothetical protein
LEVAVHKTFRTLDTVPHVLTSARIADVSQALVVNATDVPKPHLVEARRDQRRTTSVR